MATIRFTQTTTATPEQFIAGVTDFGPGRQEIFGRSDDESLVLHDQGPDWADVTEGSGGIWERLRYDWSKPNLITMMTIDSNTWSNSSGHTYRFTANPDGTTEVDVTVVRDGKNLKGKAIGALLSVIGKGMLSKAFAQTARAIESRPAGKTTSQA